MKNSREVNTCNARMIIHSKLRVTIKKISLRRDYRWFLCPSNKRFEKYREYDRKMHLLLRNQQKIVIVMEILKLQEEINQEMMNVINFS